jgi:hypothetical protein
MGVTVAGILLLVSNRAVKVMFGVAAGLLVPPILQAVAKRHTKRTAAKTVIILFIFSS